MKKFISLVALFFLFNSCSLDDRENISLELVPIVSVDIPSEFTLGQVYPITVRYNRPTNCYFFNQLYYERNLNIRTIAVENGVYQRNNCQTLAGTSATAEYTFNFEVTSNGSYIFKFYQGKNQNGESLYLEYEVPVN